MHMPAVRSAVLKQVASDFLIFDFLVTLLHFSFSQSVAIFQYPNLIPVVKSKRHMDLMNLTSSIIPSAKLASLNYKRQLLVNFMNQLLRITLLLGSSLFSCVIKRHDHYSDIVSTTSFIYFWIKIIVLVVSLDLYIVDLLLDNLNWDYLDFAFFSS